MALMASLVLSGCLSGVWTGASLIYNRHNVYQKLSDYKLSLTTRHLLFGDQQLKQAGCYLDIAVFNGDILVAGHIPSSALREEALRRLNGLSGYRELFKQIAVRQALNDGVEDIWITTKIRSQIVANSAIDPNMFKIITSDRIVYVMGDVKPSEARLVLNIARKVDGVIRVVKLLRYYHLSENPA